MTARGLHAHPGGSDIELYVLGALPPGPRRELEEHIAGCAGCAAALAAEAAFEVDLIDLWPQVQQQRRPLASVVPLRPPVPRRAAVPGPPSRSPSPSSSSRGGLAAAAVLLLFVGWWSDGGLAPRSDVALSGAASCAPPDVSQDEPGAGESPLCTADPPAPGALATWGACAAPAGSRVRGLASFVE
jgi:anti-sigma factor RsiW